MAEEPRVREAAPPDAEALAALIRAAFAEYEGRLDPPSSAHRKTAAHVLAELADGGGLAAEAGGALVGCVFWHPREGHLYLDRLAVLPAWRGRGLGRRLVGAVERLAAAMGHGRVRLSVRLALAENRALYERLGYRACAEGTHPGYAAPTFVTMEKLL